MLRPRKLVGYADRESDAMRAHGACAHRLDGVDNIACRSDPIHAMWWRKTVEKGDIGSRQGTSSGIPPRSVSSLYNRLNNLRQSMARWARAAIFLGSSRWTVPVAIARSWPSRSKKPSAISMVRLGKCGG